MISVIEYNDIYQFESDTRQFLLERESENNLILGIVQILCDPAQEYFTSWYLYTVLVENELMLVAVWTPIYNLCLSTQLLTSIEQKCEMFTSLQSYLVNKNRMISGMFAQKDDARLFANLWSETCLKHVSSSIKSSFSTKMSERLYELKPIDLKVDDLSQLSSSDEYNSNNMLIHNSQQQQQQQQKLSIDRMDPSDYETCLNWMVQFQQESGFYSNVPQDLIRKLNQNRLDLLVKNDCIFTLRDNATGQIVSMSAVNALTPNGGRVGWVYTPIEHRGKGYSQQCVSRMCDKVFREKRKQKMFLFADLANRAANHLYKKIGFKEVCDVDNLSFSYVNDQLKSNL